jgi:hypothetical protein
MITPKVRKLPRVPLIFNDPRLVEQGFRRSREVLAAEIAFNSTRIKRDKPFPQLASEFAKGLMVEKRRN